MNTQNLKETHVILGAGPVGLTLAYLLVAEGKKRQVIIFTHDIYFLRHLTDEAEIQGVPIAYSSDREQSFHAMVNGARSG